MNPRPSQTRVEFIQSLVQQVNRPQAKIHFVPLFPKEEKS